MKPLTDKQREFVSNKAAGVQHREAAIAAGYSATAAEATATKLMRDPRIRNAIKAASKSVGVDMPGTDKNTMPSKHYADPLTFLQDVMNHPHLPIAMRADAAKQLLPYQHVRLGEQGKKEKAKERAHEIVGAGNPVLRRRLAPKAPPPMMRIITGGIEQ